MSQKTISILRRKDNVNAEKSLYDISTDEIQLKIDPGILTKQGKVLLQYIFDKYDIHHLKVLYLCDKNRNKSFLKQTADMVQMLNLKSLKLFEPYVYDIPELDLLAETIKNSKIPKLKVFSNNLLNRRSDMLYNFIEVMNRSVKSDILNLDLSFQNYVIPQEELSRLKTAVMEVNVRYLKIKLYVYPAETTTFQINLFDWLKYNPNIERVKLYLFDQNGGYSEVVSNTECIWQDVPELIRTTKNIKRITTNGPYDNEGFLNNVHVAVQDNPVIEQVKIKPDEAYENDPDTMIYGRQE